MFATDRDGLGVTAGVTSRPWFGVTPTMALSDASVRAAKAGAKQYKLFDEGGLFLIVRTSGGKLWRLKYRHLGKEQQLTIGVFPDVGLKEARVRRDNARKQIAAGLNPDVAQAPCCPNPGLSSATPGLPSAGPSTAAEQGRSTGLIVRGGYGEGRWPASGTLIPVCVS